MKTLPQLLLEFDGSGLTEDKLRAEFKEIAKVMGCNLRTAQSRVRNALKIMREEHEDER